MRQQHSWPCLSKQPRLKQHSTTSHAGKEKPSSIKNTFKSLLSGFFNFKKKKKTIQWVPRISFGFEPTATMVETANVTAAAPFMELLLALFPRARLCELRSGGRCECVSPFPSNRLSDWAYHGSRRGWPLTWIVTPGIAALTGGGSCHPDTPRLTPPPHSTRTQKHTCHRQCIPSEATHERQTRRRQRMKKHRLPVLEVLSPLFIDYTSHWQPLPWHHPISPNVSSDVGADILQLGGKLDPEHIVAYR